MRTPMVFALAFVCAALTGTPAALADPPVPLGAGLTERDWRAEASRDAEPDAQEFKLINYFFTRVSVTNQLADPSGLRGVSLGPIGIGENAGSSTSVGGDTTTAYIEQRWIPVLSYSPWFADGMATFRAQFEIDYQWGQAANQIQNNQGGGLNADQVNIQTKAVHVSLHPLRDPAKLTLVIGTQPIYDNVYDPNTTSLFDIVKTGYKLAFIGSDATGLSVFSRMGGNWKASFIPIGTGQPDKAEKGDPSPAYVYMLTGDYDYELAPGTHIGASLWHLRDDTEGTAFAFEGLVKSGPGSTGLFPYTGTPNFQIEEASGSVTWAGVNFNHNIHFNTGPWAASGFFMFNSGSYKNNKENSGLNDKLDISGYSANFELMYNHGKTQGDMLTFETMITSGDDDVSDDKYTGAFTLNNYGLPGAVWFNHKTLILFPFTSTVSNYTGAVTDISNRGFGLQSAILTGSKDLIPDKLNLKLGAAFAQSAADPPPVDTEGVLIARGRTIGVEVNAELRYHIRYLMTVGLHGGILKVGDFYDANPQVTTNPWAVFSTFTWYGF